MFIYFCMDEQKNVARVEIYFNIWKGPFLFNLVKE